MTGHPGGEKISKLLSYANSDKDCADPWYTGAFDVTYAEVVAGCEGFLRYLEEQNEI